MPLVQPLDGDDLPVGELRHVDRSEPTVTDLTLLIKAVGDGIELFVGENWGKQMRRSVLMEEDCRRILLSAFRSPSPTAEDRNGTGRNERQAGNCEQSAEQSDLTVSTIRFVAEETLFRFRIVVTAETAFLFQAFVAA